MKLVVAAGGALAVSAVILFACVGDDAVTSNGPGLVDGSAAETGGGTDAPAVDAPADGPAPPTLKCALQNTPIPAQLGSFGFDSGTGVIDEERFTMFPLADKKTVAVAGIIKSFTQGTAGSVAIWTINASQGGPSPRTVGTYVIPGTRVLWVGRVSDGLGALAFGPDISGVVGWSVYKLSDSDLAAEPAPATWSRVDGPVPMTSQDFANSQAGVVIPLDQNDYFIVGSVEKASTTDYKMINARLSTSISTLTETSLSSPTLLPGAVIPTVGSMHVFVATGDFGTDLSPFHYSFNRDTANVIGTPAALPNDLLIASKAWSGGNALLFADGDFAKGTSNQVRIGSVTNLDTLDPSKLPSIPIPLSSIGLGSGADVRFWSDGLPKPILLAVGPRKNGGGVGFHYFEIDGTIRARQPADGVDALFQDVKTPAVVAATSTSVVLAPTASLATFPISWIVRGGGADTLFYSRVVCQ